MRTKLSPQERQLIKLIDQMPLSAENKQTFSYRLANDGFSEAFGEELRQKLLEDTQDQDNLIRSAHVTKLNNTIQRIRLTRQTGGFRKHGG